MQQLIKTRKRKCLKYLQASLHACQPVYFSCSGSGCPNDHAAAAEKSQTNNSKKYKFTFGEKRPIFILYLWCDINLKHKDWVHIVHIRQRNYSKQGKEEKKHCVN